MIACGLPSAEGQRVPVSGELVMRRSPIIFRELAAYSHLRYRGAAGRRAGAA